MTKAVASLMAKNSCSLSSLNRSLLNGANYISLFVSPAADCDTLTAGKAKAFIQ